MRNGNCIVDSMISQYLIAVSQIIFPVQTGGGFANNLPETRHRPYHELKSFFGITFRYFLNVNFNKERMHRMAVT